MKKIGTAVLLTFVFAVGFFGFTYLISSIKEKPQVETELTVLKDGRWINEQDSLSGIEIKSKKWIHFYKGSPVNPEDVYDYSISTKTLPEYANKEDSPGQFLKLTNETDTIHYEILNYNKDNLSLMYFPDGSISSYKPE
jgi:hypothetical protein